VKSVAGGNHVRSQQGFSLIELLIVVAIILIIAAIAIPSLIRARMAANEASAVASVRTINTAEVTYSSTYPTVGYAYQRADLGGAAPCITPSVTSACIIDSVLTSGTKSGYTLAAFGTGGAGTATAPTAPNTGYLAVATPATIGQTGTRAFCSDQSAEIYFNTDGSAIATDAACVLLLIAR
jgi:prepilin-type N-terminal cleavage/methylation domain-containing protein